MGLFRYWTVAQLPNFVLAAPVLLAMAVGVASYVARLGVRRVLVATCCPWAGAALPPSAQAALPYVLHTGVLLGVLLLASHVQIALRLCTAGGMPYVWVTVASWPPSRTLGYLSAYTFLAGVLYAGFYPPA